MTGASRETYQTIPGLDAAIVKALPDQGRKLGFHPLAPQVVAVVAALNREVGADNGDQQKLTGAAIAGRLQVLRHLGYVVDVLVQPVNKGRGWQATEAGRRWAAQEEVTA